MSAYNSIDSSSDKQMKMSYPTFNNLHVDSGILSNYEPIDDEYINVLHQQLHEIKKQRKKTEDDTKFLNSRVNCLKNEEGRTIKQIEHTQKKTQDRLIQMQRNQKDLEEKAIVKERSRKELDYLKKKNMEQRIAIERGIFIQKEVKLKNAIEEARLMKENKKNNEEVLKYRKNEEIIIKKNNNEKIKSQPLFLYEKKRANQIEKKNQIKNDLENRISEEMKIKAQNDEKIRQFQEAEEGVIQRIQETTQMHKMLIQEFEEYLIGYGNNRNDEETNNIQMQDQNNDNEEDNGNNEIQEDNNEQYYNEDDDRHYYPDENDKQEDITSSYHNKSSNEECSAKEYQKKQNRPNKNYY